MGTIENGDPYFKKEKSLNTPFELEFKPGDYSIVIHRLSKEGIIIEKIEQSFDETIKGFAQSNDEIILLTINKKNHIGATGL